MNKNGKDTMFRITNSNRKLVIANVKQSIKNRKRKAINKLLEDIAIDNYCDSKSSHR
tara:strand:- start:411 stop:581 length:171 start_codon:yes stop_codon:yes gene_type:complete